MMLCLCVVLSQLNSCFATKYKFLYDTSEITTVEFVEYGYDWEQDASYQNVLVEIMDIEGFISDLSEIKYQHFSGAFEIIYFTHGDLGIKIAYSNGDYEIISQSMAKELYTPNRNPDYSKPYHSTMGSLNETEYQNLLNKYFLPCENASFYLMHDNDKISSIEIIDTYQDAKYVPIQIPLAEVENVYVFLNKLDEIEYKYTLPSDRHNKTERRNAIKINYINGDYEVIDHEWRDLYISELDEYINNAYIGEFDKDSFDALLNEVLLPK